MPVITSAIALKKIKSRRSTIHEYRLEQNYPNPFEDATEIRFCNPDRGRVRLSIFNHNKMIQCLLERQLETGFYTVHWDGKTADGKPVADGCYTYKLEAGHFVAIRKLEIRTKSSPNAQAPDNQ